MNIWTAFLNLENLYGNDESFRKVQDEALQFNDPFKIHLHILNMYAQGNKIQDAERLGQFMLKKYKNMKDVWREVAAVYYSKGKLESARNVLQKAMASLDKKDRKFFVFEPLFVWLKNLAKILNSLLQISN